MTTESLLPKLTLEEPLRRLEKQNLQNQSIETNAGTSNELQGSVFWRLPETEPRHKNSVTLEKLGQSIARTFKNYTQQFPEFTGKNYESIAEQFCENFFLNDFDESITVYFANLSLTDNSEKRISLSIRIPAHPIFNEHLSNNVAVAVIGYCPTEAKNPIFIPERVFFTHGNMEATAYEMEAETQFQFLEANQYPSNNRSNLLKSEFTQALPKYAVKTKERLADWLDFLKFKNNLIKHKTQGLRYLRWQFNEETAQVEFLVLAENDITLKKARSAFNRQNLHAFDLKVSTHPYRFHLPQNTDRIDSSFSALGQLPNKNGIEKIDPMKDKKLANQYSDLVKSLKDGNDENKVEFDWSKVIFAKVFVEISEELANKISQLEDESSDEKAQTRQDKIEQLFKKLPETGFLSVSLVGDMALVRRHERAVKNLQQNEGCYAPYLSSYLFDIENANQPNEIQEITEWHNQDLNDKQKSAVQKMLSAPDICLIQGPPGTGKTTVIAEACLQFAKRGETVLLASQAHDALDNALSRLQNNPELRAIRLARAKDRITDEGKEFTGESVLGKHYVSLKNYLDNEYLNPVNELATQVENLRKWKENADFIAHDLNELRQKYREQNKSVQNQKALLAQHQADFDKEMSVFHQNTQLVELLDDLMAVLRDKKSHQILQSKQGALPNTLLPLARKISELANIQVKQSFTYEVLEADVDNQIAIFAYFWQCWQMIRATFHKMKADYEQLKNNPTGQLIDTQTQLKIEQLSLEIKEIESQLDDDEDNDELTNLWRQKRRERKELEKTSSQTGGLNPDIYQIFTDSDKFTQNSDTESLKSLLVQRINAIAPLGREIKALINESLLTLNNELQSITVEKPSDESIQDAQQSLDKLTEQLNATIEKGKSKREYAKKFLRDNGFDENADFTEIYQQESGRLLDLEEKLAERRNQNKDFMPLFGRWQAILSQPENRAKADWNDLEKAFVESCNLVAITCNENEKTLSDNDFDGFDVVIIDEVSKATPLELLLPLMRGKKAILVGDHRQLPPIFNEADGIDTFEDKVEENENLEDEELSNTDLTVENLRKYEKLVTASLFKELFEKAPDSLRERLTIQFRMHPDIMKMINHFYEGQLECGNPDKERKHHLEFKGLLSKNDHLLWIDTTDDEKGKRFKIDDGAGNINRLEARMIAQTLIDINRQLEQQGFGKDNKIKVGVVSFYQPQCRTIREEIRKLTGKTKGWFSAIDVEINTVIRYQGKEKPIILLSLVKNNGGDLTQKFRAGRANIARFEFINVAMSRAQNLLLVFGARNMLENREVKLPRMDEKGFDKKLVYKNMFKFLEFRAESGGLCSAQEFMQALPELPQPTKGNKK